MITWSSLRQPKGRDTLLLGMGQMIAWASGFYQVAVLAPHMAASLHIPVAHIYGMFSAGLILSALIGPSVGKRIARYGGRRFLMLSSALFATAHLLLAGSHGFYQLLAGWLVLGCAMPMGLYEAAFATLVQRHGKDVRQSMVIITLITGLGGMVAWPLSNLIIQTFDWRIADMFWAGMSSVSGLFIYRRLPKQQRATAPAASQQAIQAVSQHRFEFWMLALSYGSIGFMFSAMATGLPHLLNMAGLPLAKAILIGSLFGFAQFAGRLLDLVWLRKSDPLLSAGMAHLGLIIGCIGFMVLGAPVSVVFVIMHGLGIGLLTVAKGVLPLAIFGEHQFARRASQLESCGRLVSAITPYLFGAGLERMGVSMMWSYLFAGVIGFGGISGLIVVYRLNVGSRAATA